MYLQIIQSKWADDGHEAELRHWGTQSCTPHAKVVALHYAPALKYASAYAWFQAQTSSSMKMKPPQPQQGRNEKVWAQLDSMDKGMASSTVFGLVHSPPVHGLLPASGLARDQGWTSTGSSHPSRGFQAMVKCSHFNSPAEHHTGTEFHIHLSLHL